MAEIDRPALARALAKLDIVQTIDIMETVAKARVHHPVELTDEEYHALWLARHPETTDG